MTCSRQDGLPKQALQGPTHGATTPGPSPSPSPVRPGRSCRSCFLPLGGAGGKVGPRCRFAELGGLLSPQSNCGLEERIASLGGCEGSKLEFGSFWELIGEAAKSVKLESPAVRGS